LLHRLISEKLIEMKTYKHIFFDLDHTLWDFESNSGATLQVLFNQFQLADKGVGSFELFRSTYEKHNEKFWERYRKGFVRRAELRWKRMWHTLLEFKVADVAFAKELSVQYLEMLPSQGKLMPFALDVLDYCVEKNYEIHLITNGFEETQWQKMRTSGIDHYFKQVITSEKSNSMKPKPAIFDYALNAAGATVSESIMIGDSIEADVLGAKLYGMDHVFYNPLSKVHQHQFTYEITCLSKLKELL